MTNVKSVPHDVYRRLADGAVAAAMASLAHKHKLRSLTPIGTKAIFLGQTNYRIKPNPSIYASDWGVWLVKWDGIEWRRVKLLWRNKDFESAIDLVGKECRERKLERAE